LVFSATVLPIFTVFGSAAKLLKIGNMKILTATPQITKNLDTLIAFLLS
jgi:hypothetical protein